MTHFRTQIARPSEMETSNSTGALPRLTRNGDGCLPTEVIMTSDLSRRTRGERPACADREQWIRLLRPGNPRREQTIAKLHDVLLRVARYELSRRRGQLSSISGPEFEDLAQQAANDALMKVLAHLDEFRGLSRFTTWAYKFVIFEVSGKVARHAWRRQPTSDEDFEWEQLSDELAAGPSDEVEQREQLAALSAAIGDLTHRQREAFVAIALNGVPIDVLALRLGSNRNAIYKNLFDARRTLRKRLAAAGHPVLEADAIA
jgi:RNA polymerase sigma-70 factor, ECF subfamily